MARAIPALLVDSTSTPWSSTWTGWRRSPSVKGKKKHDAAVSSTRRAPPSAPRSERTETQWTLVLVRELRHPPAKVWTALTEPEHLREWAPFDADRDLGSRRHREALDGGSADAARHRDPGEAGRCAQAARVQLGRTGHPLGAGAAGRRRHPAHALAQHRPWLHLDGRRWLAHLLRRAGSCSSPVEPIGRIVGPDAMKFGGWQRLNAEYAKQFGVEPPSWPPGPKLDHGIDPARPAHHRSPRPPGRGPSSTGSSPRSSACR